MNDFEQIDTEDEVNQQLKKLTLRERSVIELRYGLNGYKPCTLEQAGKAYNITRERARQIEAKAIRKLQWLNSLPKLNGVVYRLDRINYISAKDGSCPPKNTP